MEYIHLKYYIRWCIKPTSNYTKNTQLTIIQQLLSNNGIMSKKDVDSIIDSHNTESEYITYIYDVLEYQKIITIEDSHVKLLDYNNFNNLHINILKNICDLNAEPKINKKYVISLCDEFIDWLNNYSEINYKNYLENNTKIIKKTLEHINDVSYSLDGFQITGLMFIFDEIENLLKTKISTTDAKKIFELLNNYERNDLNRLITEFDKIDLDIDTEQFLELFTPLLYFLDNSCPIINKEMNKVYSKLMGIFGESDEISLSEINYQIKIDCWENLMSKINYSGFTNIQLFQTYCYWLTTFIFNNPRSISTHWNMLNFPDYLIYKHRIDHINSDVTGFVILLDALGTRNKTILDETNNMSWSKLIYNLKNYFSYPQNTVDDVCPTINFSYFSDTILITFKMNDDNFSKIVLNEIGKMLSNFMIKAIDYDIFFRGCISFGRYSVNESGISGDAVNEVGDYHKLPNWIGISVTSSIYMKLMDDLNGSLDSFIFYLLHTKNGIEPNFVLNLPYLYGKNNDREQLLDKFKSKMIKQKLLNPYDSLKYRNTIEFIKSVNLDDCESGSHNQ